MLILLSIIAGGVGLLLVGVTAARPVHAPISLFELRRRKEARDRKAEEALGREELLAQLGTFRAPVKAVLLVALTLLLIYLLGWGKGVAAALAVGLLHDRLAQLKPVRALANSLYARYEDNLLRFAAKYEGTLRLIGGRAALKEKRVSLGSPEELAHVLEASSVFSDDDKRLLKSVLRFRSQHVKDIMTPESAIVSVKDTELLGPLVLNDLHKTGHTIFPVTKDGAIVGLLDSTDHVALRSKESVHVRSVMYGDITKINQTATLDEALKALIGTKGQLLIVVDDNNQTVGLISLGDVVRALTGWERR